MYCIELSKVSKTKLKIIKLNLYYTSQIISSARVYDFHQVPLTFKKQILSGLYLKNGWNMNINL